MEKKKVTKHVEREKKKTETKNQARRQPQFKKSIFGSVIMIIF
jgi:hypothetical protein